MRQAFFNKILLILILGLVLISAQSVKAICNETQCDATCVKCSDNSCHDTGFVCPVAPAVCSESQCDATCVKCSDNSCHDTGFVCREELEVESISPESIELGKSQLNILVRNTGNVDLSNIYAEVTGDGIIMVDNVKIDRLVSNDKDYAFVTITASKPGDIDLVIKLYSNDGNLKKKDTEQIKVVGAVENKSEVVYNKTLLNDNLNKLKEIYKTLDADYQNKINNGYPVENVYDNIKETNNYLKNAQVALLSDNLKDVDVNLKIAEENLNDIKTELDNAKKKQQTFMEKVKSNLLYISSLAAAVITLLTAYKLITNHINKDKLKDLSQKIKDKSNVLVLNDLRKKIKDRNEVKDKPKKKSSKKVKQVEEKIPEPEEE
ncbi:MAG: hypothetical protein PHF86_11600 [Candidatus Nanoarchaeia archaeon]|nr:hypothetical protein [Candidatus Nanoarchaeia archaeon]